MSPATETSIREVPMTLRVAHSPAVRMCKGGRNPAGSVAMTCGTVAVDGCAIPRNSTLSPTSRYPAFWYGAPKLAHPLSNVRFIHTLDGWAGGLDARDTGPTSLIFIHD